MSAKIPSEAIFIETRYGPARSSKLSVPDTVITLTRLLKAKAYAQPLLTTIANQLQEALNDPRFDHPAGDGFANMPEPEQVEPELEALQACDPFYLPEPPEPLPEPEPVVEPAVVSEPKQPRTRPIGKWTAIQLSRP